MKKIIIIVGVLVLLAGLGYVAKIFYLDKQPKNRVATLRGKYKGYSELKVFEAHYKFGVVDNETKKLYQFITFNKKGNIVSEEFYIPYSNTLIYSVGVNPIYPNKKTITEQNKNNSIRILYSYDRNNRLIKSSHYDAKSNELIATIQHTYSSNKSESSAFMEWIGEKILNSYDHDLLVKSTVFYSKDTSMVVYTYDENENEVSYIKYDKDSVMFERSSSYNSYTKNNQLKEVRGLITSIDEFGNPCDSIITVTTYSYNQNILEDCTDIVMIQHNEPIVRIYKFVYDEHGMLIERITYNQSGQQIGVLLYDYYR